MASPILIVDDDPDLIRLVEASLVGAGHATVAAETAGEARKLLRSETFSAVILDLMLPDATGQEVLAEISVDHPQLPVVVLSARDELAAVVECMRLGAIDYVAKPFDETRLLTSLGNALTRARLNDQVHSLSRELRHVHGIHALAGASPALAKSVELLRRAAGSDVSVLLTGESGTGKEVAARAVHAESARSASPFIPVNCGAIPEGLIESELFGHEKGAFTGASAAKEGLFERAHQGTIFLDEIGELRTDLQSKLLRVLQDQTVTRVGGTKPRAVDVRVIAATNRDLEAEVKARDFREDLYYRLAVFPIALPPLREREGDVMLLARHFLERHARRHRRAIFEIEPEAAAALERHTWPGNVRELENAIERAVILEDGESLSLPTLPDAVVCALRDADEPQRQSSAAAGGGSPEDILPFDVEEQRILQRALDRTEWRVKDAAERLQIGRATLYRKIDRYGLRATS